MAFGLVDHCLLVETRTELVLVDTGYGLGCVREPGKMLGASRFVMGPKLTEKETAIWQIQALGYDPRDVRHVILTHLDLDHSGGLSDFPEATVHVHGPEFRAATATPTLSERLRYRAAQWAHGPKWMVNEVEGAQGGSVSPRCVTYPACPRRSSWCRWPVTPAVMPVSRSTAATAGCCTPEIPSCWKAPSTPRVRILPCGCVCTNREQ